MRSFAVWVATVSRPAPNILWMPWTAEDRARTANQARPRPRSAPAAAVARHVLAVPVEQALAYTAERGWHVVQAPPAWWWLREQESLSDVALLNDDSWCLTDVARSRFLQWGQGVGWGVGAGVVHARRVASVTRSATCSPSQLQALK